MERGVPSNVTERRPYRVGVGVVVVALAWGVLAGRVAAHAGSLQASSESLAVPTWLFLLTGGGAVGASFLLASFVTDRAFVRAIHAWKRSGSPPAGRILFVGARTLGIIGLSVTLWFGFFGPSSALANPAILFFSGRLRAIRGQYPFIAVMVFYTMSSLRIVSEPFVTPPT